MVIRLQIQKSCMYFERLTPPAQTKDHIHCCMMFWQMATPQIIASLYHMHFCAKQAVWKTCLIVRKSVIALCGNSEPFLKTIFDGRFMNWSDCSSLSDWKEKVTLPIEIRKVQRLDFPIWQKQNLKGYVILLDWWYEIGKAKAEFWKVSRPFRKIILNPHCCPVKKSVLLTLHIFLKSSSYVCP